MPCIALSPFEEFMDLLHEVRERTKGLKRAATMAASAETNTYSTVLTQMILERLVKDDARSRIVYYACAAELGIAVTLGADQCEHAMTGRGGRSLRTLFWAANRRMHTMRRRF